MPLPDMTQKSRSVLLVGGVLSLLVGALAVLFPIFFSIVLAWIVGAAALTSGVIALWTAIFGPHVPHRVILGISGLLRMAVGAVLLIFVLPGLAAIVLLIATLLMIEGVSLVVAGLRLRGKNSWGWLVVNGVITTALGLMIYLQWPFDAAWIISVLFGINLLFSGVSMLALGTSLPKTTEN